VRYWARGIGRRGLIARPSLNAATVVGDWAVRLMGTEHAAEPADSVAHGLTAPCVNGGEPC